jgi:hypothetical protein
MLNAASDPPLSSSTGEGRGAMPSGPAGRLQQTPSSTPTGDALPKSQTTMASHHEEPVANSSAAATSAAQNDGQSKQAAASVSVWPIVLSFKDYRHNYHTACFNYVLLHTIARNF